MIFYGLMFDLLIFYGLIFGMPTYAKDWYNVTKKGNKLLRHKWWFKNKNKNTLSMTNREFSHCLSRAMVLMLRIVDVVLGMVLSLVIIPVKETIYCGYTLGSSNPQSARAIGKYECYCNNITKKPNIYNTTIQRYNDTTIRRYDNTTI